MRRVWSLASALGLLVLVGSGTWAFLTSSTGDAGTSRWTLVALGGGAVMVVGLVGRGDRSGSVAKVRRMVGGVGLVVAPIAAALFLLQLGTDPSGAVGFGVVTLVALACWAQAIALQAGLSLGAASSWLGLALAFVLVVLAIGLAVFAGVATISRAVGAGSDVARLLVGGATTVLVAAMLRRWARNRPDRQAVPGAVRRAMFGHALPGDAETLRYGAGPILRRLPPAPAEAQARATRLAELDARLGPQGGVAEPAEDHPVGHGAS